MKNLLKSKWLYIIIIIIVVLYWCVTNLFENSIARKFGGTINVTLEQNEVLMTASFKGDDVWYLVNDTVENVKKYKEYSKFGVLTGEVVFHEPKIK